MSSDSALSEGLSKKTGLFGLKIWVVIGIGIGLFMFCFFVALAICLAARSRRKLRRGSANFPVTRIPAVSKEIKEVRVDQISSNDFVARDGMLLTILDRTSDNDLDKAMVHLGLGKSRHGDPNSHSGSFQHVEKTPNRNLSSDRHQGSKKSMEAAIGKLFDSVGSFFSGGDNIPWCDRDIIAGCEKEVAESGSTENKNDSLMRLSWALVHSRQPEDVNRGIAMLETSLKSSNSPLQMREKLYLLAVGHYRNGDYSRSRQLVERCLEIAPDWRQALSLKKVVEDKTARDGVIGIGIAATAATLVVGGIAAVVARKK